MLLKTLALTLLLLAPLALGNASAAAPSIAVSMDQATYSAASTLVGGEAPLATVTITTLMDDVEVPAAGVAVTVTFLRQVQLVGFVGSESVSGVTDDNGVLTVAAPQLSGAPGSYFVVATALGANGSARYSVGA